MKKIVVLLFSILLLIGKVNAVTAEDEYINLDDYKTLNYKEILEEEEIKESFSSYSENDKQVTIYMFRGNGCGYCRNFLNFLNSITDEYGKYFKVVGFEVWSDEENSKLLEKISAFMGSEAGGVPYIIIGDNVFPGYSSEYDDGIKKAIMEQYEAKEKHNVFEDYNEAVKKAKKAAQGNTVTIVIFNLAITAIGCGLILYDNKRKYNALMSKLENNNTSKNNENNEVIKKEIKKAKNDKKKK